MKIANEGEYSEIELQASLLGRQLKERISIDDSITPEQEKAQEKAAMDALMRLKDEYLKNKVNKNGK